MLTAKQHAAEIVRTLRERGHQAYFAGGCVRDLLLGREPADYDVSTDATPRQVMQIFPQTFAVGEQFGVVLVPQYGRETGLLARHEAGGETGALARHAAIVEVATFRSDVGYSDGRHPDEVRFSKDPREDVQRRDFTINGMMLDPLVFGTTTNGILDFVGGRARRAFQLLDSSGLLPEVLPEIAAMKGVEQPPQYHPEGDVFVHTLLLLEKLQAGGSGSVSVSKTLAWGALLHDVGKPPTFRVAPDRIRFDGHVDVGVKMAAEICHRLRFSNDETDQILALVANHMRFADVERMKQSTLKKFLRLPAFDEHLELHRIDCLSSHGQLDAYEYSQEQLRSIPPEAIRPTPLITGQDLIEAGYEPSPRFKEVLSAVEDAQLEGRLTSREAAMEFVLREFPV